MKLHYYPETDSLYIELKNIGTNALQMRNTQLSGGIDFTFSNLVLTAGQRVLVVKNKAAFQSRYGPNIAVAGEFARDLSNQGDRLVLTGPLGEPILDFAYQNLPPTILQQDSSPPYHRLPHWGKIGNIRCTYRQRFS